LTSRERQYLLDILIAAEDALTFVRDLAPESFAANALVRRGVLNCLTEIGEAAARIEASAETVVPALPGGR
jgi:uncharacterized protein with HEPN domain